MGNLGWGLLISGKENLEIYEALQNYFGGENFSHGNIIRKNRME